MKKLLAYLIAPVSLLLVSCSTLNQTKLTNAALGAVTALTLSDNQVAQLSREAVAQMDAANKVASASSAYTIRLNRLTANMKDVNGLAINYKVYLTNEVNAFATGDGSIRVYSGLMDAMNDAELVAIIGHEMGHIAHADVKNAMKNTYLAYAAREAIGATDDRIALLTDSQLGDIALMYVDAQYSQKQEFAADEYGFNISVQQGYAPESMASSLEKLVQLAGGSSSSLVQKMFSSHPDSAERAARMRKKAESYGK